ncbi:MAG: hypothetical protein J6D33_10720 [Turicibacter sp.]|nr:hypothetical protein [Turicibacter sp.]
MIQKQTYNKDELKKGVMAELMVDFESFADDLATWVVRYLIDHDYSRNFKKETSLVS